MKVILVMVSTIDGKITKWEKEGVGWASGEDASYFRQIIEKNDLFVMGRKTFEETHLRPEKGKLRIVITDNPNKYSYLSIQGQLEFTSENPQQLVSRLEKQGFTKIILLGGSKVNTAFFQDSLIDELWLTIEPKIFGKGKTLILPVNLDISLKLISMEKLNKQGTLLLKYFIIDKKSSLR